MIFLYIQTHIEIKHLCFSLTKTWGKRAEEDPSITKAQKPSKTEARGTSSQQPARAQSWTLPHHGGTPLSCSEVTLEGSPTFTLSGTENPSFSSF